MLVIRNEQMQAFTAQACQEFEDGRVPEIKVRFPKAFERLQEAGVRRLVARAIALARQFGIKSEGGVGDLLDLMLLLGESFCDVPEFEFECSPLRDQTLPPEARVALTMDRLGLKSPLSEAQGVRGGATDSHE
jgi:hypothetical protein